MSKFYSIIVHSHEKSIYHESFLNDDSNCGASRNFYHRLWTVEKRVKEKYNISRDIITLQIFNPHYEHKFRLEAEFLSENFFLLLVFHSLLFFIFKQKVCRMKNYSFHHDSSLQPNLHYVRWWKLHFFCGNFSLAFRLQFFMVQKTNEWKNWGKTITMKTWKSC